MSDRVLILGPAEVITALSDGDFYRFVPDMLPLWQTTLEAYNALRKEGYIDNSGTVVALPGCRSCRQAPVNRTYVKVYDAFLEAFDRIHSADKSKLSGMKTFFAADKIMVVLRDKRQLEI